MTMFSGPYITIQESIINVNRVQIEGSHIVIVRLMFSNAHLNKIFGTPKHNRISKPCLMLNVFCPGNPL